MSGIYWSLTALHLLNAADKLPEKEMLEFVDDCLDENGGFSPAPGHYPSITYTLSGKDPNWSNTSWFVQSWTVV